jgi:hypothetical protein
VSHEELLRKACHVTKWGRLGEFDYGARQPDSNIGDQSMVFPLVGNHQRFPPHLKPAEKIGHVRKYRPNFLLGKPPQGFGADPCLIDLSTAPLVDNEIAIKRSPGSIRTNMRHLKKNHFFHISVKKTGK